MAKTRRIMTGSLGLVDAVIEVTDSRIPYSSRNPEMDRLVGRKPRLVLLNKCDTADDALTARWLEYYKNIGVTSIATDCKSGKNVQRIVPVIKDMLQETIDRWASRGMTGKAIRLMIVGIPNVGKSSLINRLAGSKRAKVEDRPGVTKGKQWVSVSSDIELLDMPGVLWPKFSDKNVGLCLAFTGAIKDDIMDMEALACEFIAKMRAVNPEALTERYSIALSDEMDDYDVLCAIGKKRGFLISGGEINTERAANILLDEFRSGKLGKITLETPEDKHDAV